MSVKSEKIIVFLILRVINIDQDNKIVKCSNDKEYKYDILILCIHTDQAKKIIKNLTKNQEKLLDMVNYKTNNIVIHSDEKIMPNKLEIGRHGIIGIKVKI